MSVRLPASFALACGCCAWLLAAAPALAEALVTVQLKDAQGQPADGTVTLLNKSGQPVAGCVAQSGQCELKDVPGGNYTVKVEPAKGVAPKARKVMIPPSGKVTLVVATG